MVSASLKGTTWDNHHAQEDKRTSHIGSTAVPRDIERNKVEWVQFDVHVVGSTSKHSLDALQKRIE